MKLKNSFLFLIFVFTSFHVSVGQEKPKAVLIDEFGALSCDDFLARTENFLQTLRIAPDALGYAVISGKRTDLRRKLIYELLIKGVIKYMNRDPSRVISVRSAHAEDFRIQYWIVPAGAENPNFKETVWDFVFAPDTKPFIFDDDSEQICPPIPFETVYVEYLNANPEARGHVVIFARSLREFNKRKRETLSLLKAIPPERLRFFHVRKESPSVGNPATIEYWLVPQKKK